jgi:hypothetical protein
MTELYYAQINELNQIINSCTSKMLWRLGEIRKQSDDKLFIRIIALKN